MRLLSNTDISEQRQFVLERPAKVVLDSASAGIEIEPAISNHKSNTTTTITRLRRHRATLP